MKILNTYFRLFLVKFNNQSIAHITDANEIHRIFKSNPEAMKNGIEYIKISETLIPKFKRISKPQIKKFIDYNTEAMELLKTVNY